MASYADQPIQFAPYVETVPVEEMVKVGMLRQEQYNQGVEKIQGWIDQVGALPVIRPVDRDYLQEKINSLSTDLKKLSGADFSKQQLVNSVGGLTANIAKDANVRAAVQSATNAQKELEFMEEARKKGELTPQNEYNYLQKYREYTESTDLGRTFSDKYNTYFDWEKFIRESFNAVKPDNITYEELYLTDEQGKRVIDKTTGKPVFSPIMVRQVEKGLSTSKAMQLLQQLYNDPRVANQLNIDGEYANRGLDSNTLKERLQLQENARVKIIDDALETQLIKKKAGEDVGDAIASLQAQKEQLQASYKNYYEAADSNPDFIRGYLYKGDVLARHTEMYDEIDRSVTYHDNPGYKAEFERQKWLDERERWQKSFNAEQFWKEAEYRQRYELAALSAASKAAAKAKGQKGEYGAGGVGPGGAVPTQGDEMSDMDFLVLQEKNYEAAASSYAQNSDEFLWQVLFSQGDVQSNVNDANLKKLTDNGMSRADGIRRMIEEAARQNKETPEQFRARFLTKAEQIFTKTPKDKLQKQPQIMDAFAAFNKSRKLFNTETEAKQYADAAQARAVGEVASKETFLEGIIPVTAMLGDEEAMHLTKEDIYDMAIYLKGNKSVLSFENDPESRRQAQAAEGRLAARGKDKYLSAMLASDLTNSSDSLGGRLANVVKEGIITSMVRGIRGGSPYASAFSQVRKVYDRMVDPKNEKALKARREALEGFYGIKPNLTVPIMTGDTETDRNTKGLLNIWAGTYAEGQKQNSSSDFSTFATNLNAEGSNVKASVVLGADFTPRIEAVVYDKDGDRKGAMTLQPDEALALNIDIDNLYENRELSALRAVLKTNNSTAKGPLDKPDTYEKGDSYFIEQDFPKLFNTPYKAKGNIAVSNGKYYPYIYVTDGVNPPVIRPLPGHENLATAYNAIILTDATLAQSILNKR